MKYKLYITLLLSLILLDISGAQKGYHKNNFLEINNLKSNRKNHKVYPILERTPKTYKPTTNIDKHISMVSAEQLAEVYIRRNASILGINDVDRELQMRTTIKSPGGQHIILEGSLNGVRVYNSEVVVTVSNDSRVSFVASNFRPNLTMNQTNPSISSASALAFAKAYLNITGRILCPMKSELTIFESELEGALLAYRIQICTDSPRGDWEVFVDAENGRIIHVKNRIMNVDGLGVIWDPDPLKSNSVYYGGEYVDNDDADNDSLNNQRVEVTLKDITFKNGYYELAGPNVKLVDIEAPTDTFPRPELTTGFYFTREQQQFEDVMAYYHIDLARRRLIELGYDVSGLDSFKVDPHGVLDLYGEGLDQSYYSITGNFCVFGEGGVDDAEDASVLWHEYAHAIQENIPPNMSYSDETAAVQEGSADYWAASYSGATSDFAWGQIFLWDAGITSAEDDTGTFWSGRRCDLEVIYPDDYIWSDKYRHKNGQIWSSALMQIWQELGRDVSDNLFIQTHFIWGSSPGLRDAAQAFIEADRLLYGGVHLPTIFHWLQIYGLIDSDTYLASIEHELLQDTEDLYGPYEIIALIVPGLAALDTSQLWVIWGEDGIFTDSTLLKFTGELNEYRAEINGFGRIGVINYYISVSDTNNNIQAHPQEAPANYHSFYTGPDVTKPVITHTPLNNQAYIRWPAEIRAQVDDNIGLTSVVVRYFVNDSIQIDTFDLNNFGLNGWYVGEFNLDSNQINIGDSIYYQLIAEDSSSGKNRAKHPQMGYFGFEIISGGGEIVFDFEMGDEEFTGEGEWQWGSPGMGPLEAYGGDNLWATRLNENYSDYALKSSLFLPKIDLAGFNNATLKFWHWYDIESGYDGGNVKVSSDSGETWQLVFPVYGYDDTIATSSSNPLEGEWAFTGQSGDWMLSHFSLDKYLGGTVWIKFDFGSDISKSAPGWYIDDVIICDIETRLKPPSGLTVVDNRGYIRLVWEQRVKNSHKKKIDLKKAGLIEADTLLKSSIIEKSEVSPKTTSSGFYYNIYKSTDGNSFILLNSSQTEVYTDSMVIPGNEYHYYITSVVWQDESIPSDTVSTVVEPVTGIENKNDLPQHFAMNQNYPNPFNPKTVISWQLAIGSDVDLSIYNVLGQKVATLIAGKQKAGFYSVDWDASGLASGVYYYRLQAGDLVNTKKLIILK